MRMHKGLTICRSAEVHAGGLAHLIPGQHDEQRCGPSALSLQPSHSLTKSSKVAWHFMTFFTHSSLSLTHRYLFILGIGHFY